MYHCTVDLLFDLFGLACFANKNKNCQLCYSWFQTSPTGGQLYSDTCPFSIPWLNSLSRVFLTNELIIKIIIFQISIRPSFGPLVFQPGPKNFMKFGVEISELQEQYPKHFIYFVTYQWAQWVRVLHYTKLKRLASKHEKDWFLGNFCPVQKNRMGLKKILLPLNLILFHQKTPFM
jgi:hypothetical protein